MPWASAGDGTRSAPKGTLPLYYTRCFAEPSIILYEHEHLQNLKWAEGTLQRRSGAGEKSTASNLRFYRDSTAPELSGLSVTERERVISAAWHFEFTAKVARQVGHFDFDHMNPPTTTQGRNAWKAQQLFQQSCCQLERVACIYNYVRGLYRQIFFSLGLEFMTELRQRQYQYETGQLQIQVDSDKAQPVSWLQLQAMQDYTTPMIFVSRAAQDEYIDILCSFGLEFLKHVLEMRPVERRRMIVETFYPFYALVTPMTSGEYIFRGVLEEARKEYRPHDIVVEEGRYDDTPASASFTQNHAWVEYSTIRSPAHPENWALARKRVDHDINHPCKFSFRRVR